MTRRYAVSFVVLVALSGLAEAQEARVNRWQPLGDGAFELPKEGYPDLVGSALVWIDDRDEGVVIPNFSAQPLGFRTLSGAAPKWTLRSGQGPEKRLPDRWESPRAYCYLPGLKRVLLLRQEWSYSPNKQPAAGWLLDPDKGAWEPIDDPLSMSERSADFNVAAGRDGLRLPIWGSLCYDPINEEAVAVGGGGTWGRVGKEQEPVRVGDWIFDESVKRIRRLNDKDKVAEARRWFPGQCGTWTFSTKTKKWSALAQPLGKQPGGRILPGLACDTAAKKIVLFGGDDLARCLGETWIYDCQTRTWAEAITKTAPTPRAGHALVYVPEAGGILLAGGYAGGWKPLADVWFYSVTRNEWTRLDLNLPEPAAFASAVYDAKRKQVVLASYGQTRGNKKLPLYSLQLDLAKAGSRAAEKVNPDLDYHCKARRAPTDLPGEWLAGAAAPEDAAKTRAGYQELPANRWKKLTFPKNAPERNWGSYIYDPKTQRAFAWGGGHSAYAGAEMSEFDLLGQRWRGMADATNYNPIWLHGMVGGPPGVSFGGWSLLPTHARKSYGVDPLTGLVITYVGDVYDPAEHRFTANIGEAPGKYGVATQVAFVTARHGLYGYSTGTLVRANAAAGKWDTIAKGGPTHEEHHHLCYDSKRDRLVYFTREAKVWIFDFASKAWSEEQPAGKTPARALGDSTYVPELDAALLIFAEDKGQAEKLYFYKLDDKKWYTAPSEGDAFAGSNLSGRDWSPHYDPHLKLLIRITPTGFAQWLNVHVLRLDPKTLQLTAIE